MTLDPNDFDIITDRPPLDEEAYMDDYFVHARNESGHWCIVDVDVVRRHWGTYYTAWTKLKGNQS